MNGQYIDGRFEAAFTIPQPIEQVWSGFEQSADSEPDWLGAWPRMPGFDSTATVIEVDAPRRLRASKTSEPCRGSEIGITLDPLEQGTRVTVVQSKLPAWVQHSTETFVFGGKQIVADLAMFLERGVMLSRHSMPWAFPGLVVREVTSGLEVTAIVPGGFADKVGLEPGDLLTTFGGAPVFTQACLQALLRVFKPGDDVEVCWVRGRNVHRATNIL